MNDTKVESFFAREIDVRNLAWGILAITPNLLLYFFTGSLFWFHGALVTMCLLIVQTRIGPSLALLGVHAITMAVLTTLFYLSVSSTYAFALLAATTGFATFWIMRLDSRLATFGTWNFIPPLYIACEMASIASGPDRITGLEQLLSVWPISVISVALVLRPPLFARSSTNEEAWRRWIGLASPDPHPKPAGEVYRSAGARAISVLLATGLMEWVGVGNGEWGIWSAASVANADSTKALDKFKNRALGAIAGVLSGFLLGPFLPHSTALYISVVLGIFLTITVLKRYIVSFAARCFLVTIAAYVAAHGIDAGRERVMNVVTGSIVGLLVTIAFKFLPGLWRTKSKMQDI